VKGLFSNNVGPFSRNLVLSGPCSLPRVRKNDRFSELFYSRDFWDHAGDPGRPRGLSRALADRAEGRQARDFQPGRTRAARRGLMRRVRERGFGPRFPDSDFPGLRPGPSRPSRPQPGVITPDNPLRFFSGFCFLFLVSGGNMCGKRAVRLMAFFWSRERVTF